MIWGKDELPNLPVRLGEAEIRVVRSCNTLANDRKLEDESYNDRIGTSQNSVFAALGIGSFTTLMTPLVLSKLYWSVTMPKLTYGMEVVPVLENGILQFTAPVGEEVGIGISTIIEINGKK